MKNTKFEYRNPKQIRMTKILNSKRYDLEDRTIAFAKNVRSFVKKVKKTLLNIEDCKQLNDERSLEHLNLGIRICFGFRIWDLGFHDKTDPLIS